MWSRTAIAVEIHQSRTVAEPGSRASVYFKCRSMACLITSGSGPAAATAGWAWESGAFFGFGVVGAGMAGRMDLPSEPCANRPARQRDTALFLKTPRQLAMTQFNEGRLARGVGQWLPAGEELGDQRLHFRLAGAIRQAHRSQRGEHIAQKRLGIGGVHPFGHPFNAEKVAAELHDLEAVTLQELQPVEQQ